MIKKYETAPFDYNGSIKGQIDVINQFINDAGNSGFSASCVGSGVFRETHSLKGNYMVTDFDKFLYPQYNPLDDLHRFMTESSEWFLKEAKKKIVESPDAHPDVMRRWELVVKHNGDIHKALEEHNKIGEADETEYIRKIKEKAGSVSNWGKKVD